MSLTNIVYTPVDTGTAKIRPKVENANLKDFYLLTGKLTPMKLKLRRSVRGSVILIIGLLPPSPSPIGKERYCISFIIYITTTSTLVLYSTSISHLIKKESLNKLALCDDGPASAGSGRSRFISSFRASSYHPQTLRLYSFPSSYPAFVQEAPSSISFPDREGAVH